MIKSHNIKIIKRFADSILCGDKLFEVRRNDREYQKGDIVTFIVVGDEEDCDIKISHKLNDNYYEITYVLSSFYGLAPGYVAFGIKQVENKRV